MRIVCISDTHSLHKTMEKMFNKLPEGDILVHAGDCTNVGKPHEVIEFVNWFKKIEGYRLKIFIAGNHDFVFENVDEPHEPGEFDWYHELMNEENLKESNVVYLKDSEYLVYDNELPRPLKIYGSPWQPEFFNWAFNLPRSSNQLESKWKNIPTDTDILITHGPPNGFRDYTPYNVQVGCEILRFHVEYRVKPLIHVFGHIHHSYGAVLDGETMYVNASICTERYIPSNKPIIIEIKEENGVLITEYVENN